MPNTRRVKQAIEKCAGVCTTAVALVEGEKDALGDARDHLDMVLGGAHQNASDSEIEAMLEALDEAIMQAHEIATDVRAQVDKLREARGRLDRVFTQQKAQRAPAERREAAAQVPTGRLTTDAPPVFPRDADDADPEAQAD